MHFFSRCELILVVICLFIYAGCSYFLTLSWKDIDFRYSKNVFEFLFDFSSFYQQVSMRANVDGLFKIIVTVT